MDTEKLKETAPSAKSGNFTTAEEFEAFHPSIKKANTKRLSLIGGLSLNKSPNKKLELSQPSGFRHVGRSGNEDEQEISKEDLEYLGKLRELQANSVNKDEKSDPTLAEEIKDKDRKKAVKNLYNSEILYNGRLYTVEQYYTALTMQLGNDDRLQKLNKMFNFVSSVKPVHKQLLESMSSKLHSWNANETIGDVFLQLSNFLTIYADIMDAQLQTIKAVNELIADKTFFNCTTASDETEIILLFKSAFERLPQYIVELQNIQKVTPPNHPDQELINKVIKLLANILNTAPSRPVKEEENANPRIGRTLLLEGQLENLQHRSQYKFWLFSDLLVGIPLAKTKHRSSFSKRKYQWPLGLVWIKDYDGRSTNDMIKHKKAVNPATTFEIRGPDKRYVLNAKTAKLKEQWMTIMGEAIQKHLKILNEKEIQAGRPEAIKDSLRVRNHAFEFENGAYYSGWWLNGEMDGQGVYTILGNEYIGEFRGGKKQGAGVLKYSQGGELRCSWTFDLPNGEGTFKVENCEYVGSYKDGLRWGQGKFYDSVGGAIYEGEWERDLPSGKGIFRLRDGSQYDGEWLIGKRHGMGNLQLATGETYVGEWAYGVRHGLGKITYENGDTYDGGWKEGLRHGKGELTTYREIYKGDFILDQKEGEGTLTLKSGGSYSGAFYRNFFWGKGRFTYSNGFIQSYDGQWETNRWHGTGALVLCDGTRIEGTFQKGEAHGMMTIRSANGNVLTATFEYGTIKPEGRGSYHVMGQEKIIGSFDRNAIILSQDMFVKTSHPTHFIVRTIPILELSHY